MEPARVGRRDGSMVAHLTVYSSPSFESDPYPGHNRLSQFRLGCQLNGTLPWSGLLSGVRRVNPIYLHSKYIFIYKYIYIYIYISIYIYIYIYLLYIYENQLTRTILKRTKYKKVKWHEIIRNKKEKKETLGFCLKERTGATSGKRHK